MKQESGNDHFLNESVTTDHLLFVLLKKIDIYRRLK